MAVPYVKTRGGKVTTMAIRVVSSENVFLGGTHYPLWPFGIVQLYMWLCPCNMQKSGTVIEVLRLTSPDVS